MEWDLWYSGIRAEWGICMSQMRSWFLEGGGRSVGAKERMVFSENGVLGRFLCRYA